MQCIRNELLRNGVGCNDSSAAQASLNNSATNHEIHTTKKQSMDEIKQKDKTGQEKTKTTGQSPEAQPSINEQVKQSTHKATQRFQTQHNNTTLIRKRDEQQNTLNSITQFTTDRNVIINH